MKKNKVTDVELNMLDSEVSDLVDDIKPLVNRCADYDAHHDLHLLMQNEEYRHALVCLYGVLLEVDMRNNPDRYVDKPKTAS